MMIGEYPCCDGPLLLPIPEDRPLPTFAPETCPHCGAKVWHRFCRLDPQTWTEAGFLAWYDVDEEARTVTRKWETFPGREDLSSVRVQIIKALAASVQEEWEREILFGAVSDRS